MCQTLIGYQIPWTPKIDMGQFYMWIWTRLNALGGCKKKFHFSITFQPENDFVQKSGFCMVLVAAGQLNFF